MWPISEHQMERAISRFYLYFYIFFLYFIFRTNAAFRQIQVHMQATQVCGRHGVFSCMSVCVCVWVFVSKPQQSGHEISCGWRNACHKILFEFFLFSDLRTWKTNWINKARYVRTSAAWNAMDGRQGEWKY